MLYSKREAADNHDGWGRKNKGLLLFFFLSFLTVDAPGLKPRIFVVFRFAIVQQFHLMYQESLPKFRVKLLNISI